MIGKTNAQTGSPAEVEYVNISLASNQSSSADINGATVTLAYGSYSKTYTWGGTEITASVPAYVTYTLTFSSVSGYRTPDVVTYTAVGGNSRSVVGTYMCSVVTVNITDNQTSYNDIASATATVTGSATGTLSSGGTIKVPWGGSITVTGSSVSGYKTPSTTYTAADVTKAITLTYATEILTVTVGTDGATPSGYTVTVKKSDGTTLGSQTTSSKTYKIPYGTQYYITASAVNGFTTPANSSTYTAAGSSNASRSVTMTYNEIKNETLTVTVTGISSGFTLTIRKSDGTIIASQTATTGTYSIEAGTQYYVKASSVSGYVTPSNSPTRTAVAGASHTVVMAYAQHAGTTNPSNGVYIRDTDGFFHTTSAWDGTYTADSVAVITSNCSFRIALANAYSSTCRWGGYGTEVGGITTTTSESTAQGDYDGEAQTTTIINALKGTNDGYVDGAPAVEYCRAYTFPDGSIGYMGAAGEWQAALDNKSAIASALSACGGTAMSNYYWTSTQYSSGDSWYVYWSFECLNADLKSLNYYVRAFAAI